MIVFPVFVCILGKCSEKYSTLCVWSNVKQNKEKNSHPKPLESTKNGNHHCQPPKPTPQPTTSHPATHREPNPHRNQPKTHSATHRNPLHKTKNQTPNQPNPINFDPPATIKPITGKTITQNRQQSNPWQI
jgi:hypothetical protein